MIIVKTKQVCLYLSNERKCKNNNAETVEWSIELFSKKKCDYCCISKNGKAFELPDKFNCNVETLSVAKWREHWILLVTCTAPLHCLYPFFWNINYVISVHFTWGRILMWMMIVFNFIAENNNTTTADSVDNCCCCLFLCIIFPLWFPYCHTHTVIVPSFSIFHTWRRCLCSTLVSL